MSRLVELLRQNQEAVARRWLEAALSSYAALASAAFAKEADPFANPVGHSLREGTRGILAALLADAQGDAQADAVRGHLRPIISIRAVQEMSASQAIAFVFQLKAAVRAELGEKPPMASAVMAGQAELAAELNRLDAAIDRVALWAFDLYVEARERISQVRVQEANRRVSWIAGKLEGCDEKLPRPARAAK